MSLSRQPLEDILAGPVKQLMWELRKRCRVKMIDEFRTSKICSKCEGLFCKLSAILGISDMLPDYKEHIFAYESE